MADDNNNNDNNNNNNVADELHDNNNKDDDDVVYEQAAKEVNVVLDETGQRRPKHLGQGLTKGIGCILQGAVGSVGIAILTPAINARKGHKVAGIAGGVMGGVGGVFVGTVQGVGVAAGGVVAGADQIVRGVGSTPESITAPRQGKWWNEAEGRWILTDLNKQAKLMERIPKDDADILEPFIKEFWQEQQQETEDTRELIGIDGRKVKDPYYYDVLKVDFDANDCIIQRKYYIMARKYAPERAGNEHNDVAAKQFREIGEAYCVLRNDTLRKKYDKYGHEALRQVNFHISRILGDVDDDDDIEEENNPRVDPVLLYAFLFGSDKFHDYIGRLAAARSASVGDDNPNVTLTDARKIQQRRVTRLALKLAERLDAAWTKGEVNTAVATWQAEAGTLSRSSYGVDLVHVIGKVYTLSAVQFLGSTESGIGMPSISAWAKSTQAAMKENRVKQLQKVQKDVAQVEHTAMITTVQKELLDKPMSNRKKKALKEQLTETMLPTFVRNMWVTTVVDITSTLHETVQMVLHDQSVDADIRRKRGEGLKVLGEVFAECPAPEHMNFDMESESAYEEIAFAAMLDYVKRKDEIARAASKKA